MAKSAGEGTRGVTLLIGALDALVSVVMVLAVLVAGTSLSWVLDAGSSTPWISSFRNAVDIWFVMHGVSLSFGTSTLLDYVIPAFTLWILPLGAALLIFGIAWRGGKRLFGAKELWPAWFGAAAIYAGCSALLLNLSRADGLTADPVTEYVLPSVIYVGGLVSGSLFGARPPVTTEIGLAAERKAGRKWVETLGERVNWVVASVASPALRAGTGFVFAMQAISGAVLAVMVAFNWLGVIQLYEQLQGGIFGGFGATLLQLSVLPNFNYYVSTWFCGPGFAIGTGSSVSPLGTALGPLPTVPLFGAIPAGNFSVGMIAIVVPVLVALAATVLVKKHAAEARHNFATPLSASIAMGLSIGLVAAVEMTVLALITHASIGPGRMQDVGADPMWVFVWVFIEVTVVAFLASFYAAKPNAASPIPEHLKR